MIGVAFFAFSSCVCLAQAKKQEKELAAGSRERKDKISVLRTAQAKKEADILRGILSDTIADLLPAWKTTGMHARMKVRQMFFDYFADQLVESVNPSAWQRLEEWTQKREASAWIAIGTIYGFVFGTWCGFADLRLAERAS